MSAKMYSGPLTKANRVGDLVIHEESHIFCRESDVITNIAQATNLVNPVGYPLTGGPGAWTLVVAAGEAGTAGLLLLDSPLVMESGETSVRKYAILVRGPAVVNENVIPTLDAAGAGFNVANIVTALAALNIIARPMSPTMSTQTS